MPEARRLPAPLCVLRHVFLEQSTMHARYRRRRGLWGAVVIAAGCSLLAPGAARAQFRDAIPSRLHFAGVEQLYRGEYRDAQRSFTRALNGAVRTLGPTGQIRWIDSICYHAMLGETFYHWGQPAAALEQYNLACSLYLQNPRWMLRIQFDATPTPATRLARSGAPWGVSQRQTPRAEVSETMAVAQGSLDSAQAALQGGSGVVTTPQLWPVNVVEVVRCTALAIRRRNEILGPQGPYDTISKNLVLTLNRGGGPPNHWSSAWHELPRGLAHAGVGEAPQAIQALERATLLGGGMDHPLTAMALLEQGRLALDAGETAAAAELFAEASQSAFVYGDAGVVDEAFRWAALAHLASGATEVDPALAPAAEWARRERFSHIAARINLALAEQLMTAGDYGAASAALAAGTQQLGDGRTGLLGNRALFLEAKSEYHRGRESAGEKLAAALQGQAGMCLQNYQIQLANGMFDAQTLPVRSAAAVYELLLSDPTPADAVLRLLESMAVMGTPHDAAFERWLIAALERGNMGAAAEITDRAKRRRFHNIMPWGGRLGAVRELLLSPAAAVDPQRQQQRAQLVARFDDFAQAADEAASIRKQLHATWLPGADDAAVRKATALWKDYSAALTARELQLGDVALSPIPAELSFPPLLLAAGVQRQLRPGQALLVYHETTAGLQGFLFTGNAVTQWDCGPTAAIGTLVSQFLRELGNYDANREMTAEDLASEAWQQSSSKLARALLEGSSFSPASTAELIVVPDSVVWYVPFEALVSDVDGQSQPFLATTKVRYAPTIGLAFRSLGNWRRIQRTGLVLGEVVPGEKPEQRAAVAAGVAGALPGAMPLELPSPAPSPDVASLLDALVVLRDVDANGPDPFAWSPLPIDRAEEVGALDQWLAIGGDGPQRVILPAMHTLAERGGKPP
ncbi:MAG TPA: hypothetical protein VEQ85_10790, partial [Lacipirellulaceae bacterium]|nr:hypothetical protein [Lacipirellulaceae bacterium]